MIKPLLRIAVTPGAENGVGPELLAQALSDYKGSDSLHFSWCGDLASLRLGCERARVALTVEKNRALLNDGVPIDFFPDLPQGLLVRQARFLEISIEVAQKGLADAIVTGPVEKAALAHLSGGPFAGQTEFFSAHLGLGEKPFMAFVGGPFMLTLLTTHLPLRNVADAITEDGLFEHLTSAAGWWARMHGKTPAETKITLLGLNPHAGEHGLIGTEEERIFSRAILRAQKNGLNILGPFAADGFFAYLHRAKNPPDVVVAPYHDQGLSPYKLLSHGGAVNVTCGLSIPRTSPAHGIASEIAGTRSACPLSTKAALKTAIDLARGFSNP